jgi:nitrate/TMAO reductase-like tetraheme cytochrome c subunit
MGTANRFLAALGELLRHPTSNITAAMLLAAVIATVLLAAIIGVLMLLASGAEEEEEEETAEAEAAEPVRTPPAAEEVPPSPEERRRRLAETVIILLIALGIAIPAFAWASGTDRFCSDQCHQVGKGSASSRQAFLNSDGAHDEASCISCHETGGSLSLPSRLLGRVQHTATSYLGFTVSGVRTPVQSGACLSCHEDILKRTVESTETGIRMAHAQPVEKGATCTDCHSSAGHGGSDRNAGMGLCLRCHDGKTASTECSTCHTRDTSLAIKADDKVRIFNRIQLNPMRDCEGCHPSTSCDKCHGIRMPHSYQFIKYGHARYAGFERKQLCWRCHVLRDCGYCHNVSTSTTETWAHGNGWKALHGKNPAPRSCACHMHPDNLKGNFCAACH